TARLEVFVDRRDHLRREVLLRLKAARIHVDHARDLRQSNNAFVREVREVRTTDDRKHVVLTVRVERDVTNQDEIIEMTDLAEGAIQHVLRALLITREEICARTRRSGVSSKPSRFGLSPIHAMSVRAAASA